MNATVYAESISKNNNKKMQKGLGGQTNRTIGGGIDLKVGDVITWPSTPDFDTVENIIRDKDGVETGSFRTVLVDRTRGDQTKTIELPASVLNRQIREVDADGYYTGEWFNACGEPVDLAQEYASLDDAVVAVGQHGPVKVTQVFNKRALRYEHEEGDKDGVHMQKAFGFAWA